MMELGDHGVKDPEDILAAISSGKVDAEEVGAAVRVYGDRFSLLLVDALFQENRKRRRLRDLIRRLLVQSDRSSSDDTFGGGLSNTRVIKAMRRAVDRHNWAEVAHPIRFCRSCQDDPGLLPPCSCNHAPCRHDLNLKKVTFP